MSLVAYTARLPKAQCYGQFGKLKDW